MVGKFPIQFYELIVPEKFTVKNLDRMNLLVVVT